MVVASLCAGMTTLGMAPCYPAAAKCIPVSARAAVPKFAIVPGAMAVHRSRMFEGALGNLPRSLISSPATRHPRSYA